MPTVAEPLRPSQAARRLNVRPSTVRRWLVAGHLRGVKLPGGGGWRVSSADVDRLLAALEVGESNRADPAEELPA